MARFTYLDPRLQAERNRFQALLERLRGAELTDELIGELEDCIYEWVSLVGQSSAKAIANDLALAVAVLELLQAEPTLPSDLRDLTGTACHRLRQAAGRFRTPPPLSAY